MNKLLEIKNKIQELKPEHENRFHISSIGLFGSVAREDFNEKAI